MDTTSQDARSRQLDASAASRRSRELLERSLVWDMTVPGMFSGLNEVQALHRYQSAGFGFVSVTIGNDSVWSPDVVLDRLDKVGSEIARASGRFRVVKNATEILAARAEGKLAIGFH